MYVRLKTLVVAFLVIVSSPALAGPSDVGIVLMHGKWANPPTTVLALSKTLSANGYLVETPLMAWSGMREYDVDYPATLTEIDAVVKALRAKGAKRIVVAGHSSGANAALAYAGSGRDVDGIVAIAPGHTPERRVFKESLASSVDKARAMIADGKGDEKATFDDFNQGKNKSVRATAKSYFSYFDPAGLGVMPKSAAAIRKPTPLLVITPTHDPLYSAGETYIFAKAPQHPKSKYLVVETDHMGGPAQATDDIVQWLKSLEY
jgi:dienelactone hydrolase